jgi:hypothetical protein
VLIREVLADHYSIPLPVPLSDSTHGTIKGFELVTARVRDLEAHGFGLDRFIAEPLRIDAGLAIAPERPGA